MNNRLSRFGWIVACTVLVIVLAACGNASGGKPQNEQAGKSASAAFLAGRWGTVVRVIDGDTVELQGGERVRLIGVNTPETAKRDTPGQPYAKEAASFTEAALLGKKVFVETDVQRKDQYGRTLAYLYTQEPRNRQEAEAFIYNALLLREGYAQLMTVPPNLKYADLFLELQRQARESNRGLWALGLYKDAATSTNDVFLTGKATQPPASEQPVASASGHDHFSHLDVDHDCKDFGGNTNAATAFMKASVQAGYGDHRLDRDEDGIACE